MTENDSTDFKNPIIPWCGTIYDVFSKTLEELGDLKSVDVF